MSEPSAKSKTPAIRFKGFSGEWVEEGLGNITSKIGSGKTPKGGSSTYASAGIPLLRSQNIYNNMVNLKDVAFITQITHAEMENSEVLKNDVLLNITGASIGRSAVYSLSSEANVNQHVCIIRLKEGYQSNYTQLLLASSKGQKQIENNQAGGAREGLNFQHIGRISFIFPPLKEQTNIGKLFQQLDTLINQHQQKHEKLRCVKKALLTKMFPKQGETQPAIRFKGFRAAWEVKAINELFFVTRGNVLAVTETREKQSHETPYPVYSSQTKNNGLMGFYKEFLFENAITWTTDGANAGTVNYRNGKFYSTNVNGVLLSETGYANKAVAEILNRIAWKHVSHVGNPKLMNNVMSEIKICIPYSIEEQQKIALLLEEIDFLVSKHQSQLTKLNNIKQAMLAKMFV